ncbi:MAG TPA: NAD-dependent epimerase/dehydratase family protein [Anaerolineae bacterium]|nr:NAD-dependent epimerase/dehydratase family protein [Anaerolineae bacterium]
MGLRGKSVLVTGGAGFIGSHLVDRIIQEDVANLVVVDSFFLGREENLTDASAEFPELKVYRLDASDLAAMRHVTESEGIQVVFDLAVVPLPTSLIYPMWTFNTNVGIATTFCELARWGCIETLLHCSSSEAYGTAQYVPMDENHPQVAITPYAASKAAADQIVLSYVRTFGIDAVIVRPFNTFGPRQNPGRHAAIIPIVVRRATNGSSIEIHGDGEQTRDYIFVRDTADAIVRICESEASRGKVVNVATGHEISINELVGKLLRVMGVPDHPVVHTSPRPGDVRRHCGDITLARKLIGFEPAALMDEDLQETVDWYLARMTK